MFSQTTNPFPTRPSFDDLISFLIKHADAMDDLAREGEHECKYRMGDRACLVGALLTDDQASLIEGFSWGAKAIDTCDPPSWMTEVSAIALLDKLQTSHDSSGDIEDLRTRLRDPERQARWKKIYVEKDLWEKDL